MQQQIIRIILSFTLLFTGFACHAQPSESLTDEQLINEAIEMYFDGWMTGDTIKIGHVMHRTCKLKLIKEEKVLEIDRHSYLSNFSPRPAIEGALGRIIDIDITNGKVASAKCELEIPNRIYTDYFNMMKLNEKWYIVDKISTNVSK